jgi:hypothetical protein
VLANEAPTVGEYLPRAHGTQSAAWEPPWTVRYLPALHCWQLLAPLAAAKEPPVQSLQARVPETFVNFPGTQSAHAWPFLPEEPIWHLQASRAELPAGESAFFGHSMQEASELAPRFGE